MGERRRRREARRSAALLDWLAWVSARAGVALLGRVPEPATHAFAAGLAWIAVRVDRRHVEIARSNLDLAYGDALDAAEKQRIVRESYAHMLRNAVEFIHAVRRARRGLPPIELEVVNPENLVRATEGGRAALFVSGHLGNWEFAPIGPRLHGVELHSIATPRRNPRVDRELIAMRESLGQTIVWKRGAFQEGTRLLREGRSLGVLSDQNQRKGGVFVPFFGVRASATRGPALLARRTGAWIVPAAMFRLPGIGRHRLVLGPPIEPQPETDAEADVLRMTAACAAWLESQIREAPEQWLWAHRRWRTRPWQEVRRKRDVAAIQRGFAAAPHGHGPALEPPVMPWADAPAAIRKGRSPWAPVPRVRPRIEASPALAATLRGLRGR